MRINNFFLFRTKRKPVVFKIDTVSFDSFQNEFSPSKRELTMDSSSSENSRIEYERFSRQKRAFECSFPNMYTVLAILFLIAFFVLPILYLLYCFGIIYSRSAMRYENEGNAQFSYLNQVKEAVRARELPFPPIPNQNQCHKIEDADKLDCFPQGIASEAECEKRGCCWNSRVGKGIPYCFYPSGASTYNFVNVTETAFGLIAFLKREFRTISSYDIETIKMIVKYETETRLHIKITDALNHRFEPSYPEIPIVDRAASDLHYKFEIEDTKSGFRIVRKDDGVVIFDSFEFQNMIFSKQFLQISGRLPSNFVYGLGEHRGNFMLPLNWTKFTFFNSDSIPEFGSNLYGTHPFYMVLENSTKAHGVFLLNSNAMDVVLQPSPGVTFRTIGGVLDMFFFLGPSASDVVSQYVELVGRPYLPPYWGLGFHLCRFGYKTLDETRKVMERNIAAGIPLDTQWNDLDYMNNSKDFTYDKSTFKNLPNFVKELHANGMHYVPIIDPGVSDSEPDGSYPPYDEGVKMDIFVKDSNDRIFIGKVWNRGTTVWPDFTHPNTVDYWTMMLKNFHDEINFDGAWIDMNEPSNFLSGSTTGCPNNTYENPPYLPNINGGKLYHKTMCMSCKHYAGLHYDVHNLYGLTEAIVTNFALAEIRGKRPFVISRSSFPGLGHYAGHWSGDVWSSWNDMRWTIPQLLSFSLFGVPLMGADICGFNGNSSVSLCNRWMQLGAFYPFSRNHNTDDGNDQDPVAMGDLVVNSSRKALRVRYTLLPYLYTLFWRAHVDGETVARPLFFEFVGDRETYSIDTQFLWGSAIMIIPVLEENAETVRGYLPKAVWYNFYTKASIISKGEFYNISAPLDTIPLFIRGGSVIPRQQARNTSIESRKTLVELLVALDEQGSATGQLYWDDGDSLNTYEEKQFSVTNFEIEGSTLRISNIYRENFPPNLGKIEVMGVQKVVSSVLLNGKSKKFKFDPVLKILLIEYLDLEFKKGIVVTWM